MRKMHYEGLFTLIYSKIYLSSEQKDFIMSKY